MKYLEVESSTVELKREIPSFNQIARTAVSFANLYGGRIVIGVNDDRTINGINDELVDKLLNTLGESIFTLTSPAIIPSIHVKREGDKSIIVIDVPEGMQKPYFLSSEGLAKGTYVRSGRSSLRATSEVIDNLRWQSRGKNYDEQPLFRSIVEDLDKKQILDFINSIGYKEKRELAQLSSLREYKILVEDSGRTYPTKGGMLLFGQKIDRFFSEAYIVVSVFSNEKDRVISATIDCSGSIMSQIKNAYDFIIKNLSKSVKIKNLKRDEKLEIPSVAIREALVNAVAHRDYSIAGPIKIGIYPNRIEIFNPGIFPGPIPQHELKSGITYIRNSVICRVLREVGMVEKLGTGLATIFNSYEKANLKEPSIIEGDGYVKCILPREMKLVSENQNADREDSYQIERLIEQYDSFQMQDIVGKYSASRSSIGRILGKLVRDGRLIKRGKGRGVSYEKAK